MKKIIVTGHNGYIGSHLVRILKEAGYFVIGIDTNYFDKDCQFSEQVIPDIEIFKDIRNLKINDIDSAYGLCHLAALSNDPVGALNEKLTYEINHEATISLAKLSKKAGIEKFIFSSSCSMYGTNNRSEYLDENVLFQPVTAYAISKVNSENDLCLLNDNDFSVTFLRNATAYGTSPKLRLDLVVNNLVGWGITTGSIRIMSDGTPWRPLIHVEDIARAFLAVLESKKEQVSGKAFNVGQHSENYQIKDIAKMIKTIIPNCDLIITGEHGSDSRSYKVDFSKIKEELPNFQPIWKLENAIGEIYSDYRKFKMNKYFFNSRYFIRIKQLEYLLSHGLLDNSLFWINN